MQLLGNVRGKLVKGQFLSDQVNFLSHFFKWLMVLRTLIRLEGFNQQFWGLGKVHWVIALCVSEELCFQFSLWR